MNPLLDVQMFFYELLRITITTNTIITRLQGTVFIYGNS